MSIIVPPAAAIIAIINTAAIFPAVGTAVFELVAGDVTVEPFDALMSDADFIDMADLLETVISEEVEADDVDELAEDDFVEDVDAAEDDFVEDADAAEDDFLEDADAAEDDFLEDADGAEDDFLEDTDAAEDDFTEAEDVGFAALLLDDLLEADDVTVVVLRLVVFLEDVTAASESVSSSSEFTLSVVVTMTGRRELT